MAWCGSIFDISSQSPVEIGKYRGLFKPNFELVSCLDEQRTLHISASLIINILAESTGPTKTRSAIWSLYFMTGFQRGVLASKAVGGRDLTTGREAEKRGTRLQ